jgi:Fe-S cluster assembly protein SufD
MTRTRDKGLTPAGLTPSLPQFKGTPGWEFTDISKLDLAAFEPGAPADAAPAIFDRSANAAPLGEHELLGTVVTKEDVFTARNRDSWSHGALVHVPAGERLAEPVVVRAGVGRALEWRTLIVLEPGAEAEVWEEWVSADGEGESLLNAVTEIVVGEGATLHYVGAQALSESTWIFGNQRALVARDATLDWSALAFGSMRGKVWMETKLAGQGSTARVTGAYVPRGRQHLDFDTLQEHAAPNTVSDLAFRGVLGGRASAVWRGMIKVDPGAQKTDAFQECRNLLLSKRAHADAIPGLEIEADDVRCTHAAAVAQLDRDQLYYLRAHGLPEQVAQRLIIDGFLQELVARLADGPIRAIAADALERRLAGLLA